MTWLPVRRATRHPTFENALTASLPDIIGSFPINYNATSVSRSPGRCATRSFSTSMHPEIASLMFSRASSSVSPCEWHPGIAGQLTTYPPSSGSSLMITRNFISMHPITSMTPDVMRVCPANSTPHGLELQILHEIRFRFEAAPVRCFSRVSYGNSFFAISRSPVVCAVMGGLLPEKSQGLRRETIPHRLPFPVGFDDPVGYETSHVPESRWG